MDNFQVHSKNFNVGVQALMLLDKISSKNQVVSDRFYRALYSKLLLPSAMNSSKASEVESWLNFVSMQYACGLMLIGFYGCREDMLLYIRILEINVSAKAFCNCVEHDCKVCF